MRNYFQITAALLALLFSGALCEVSWAVKRARTRSYQCAEDLTWRSNNNQWYVDLGEEKFQEQARAKGLANHADYQHKEVTKLLGMNGGAIPPAVLVIGAGFGRDLEFLTEHTNVSQIYAVEVGNAQLIKLREKYGFDSDVANRRERGGMAKQRVDIYDDNIMDLIALPEKIQVAFWMFAGVLELSPGEKWQAIQNLSQVMDVGGTVVVDVPLGKIVSKFEIIEGEDTIRLRNPKASGRAELSLHPINHFTNEVDKAKIINAFQRDRKFSLYRTIDYRTDTDQKRQLLMFIKN